MKFSVHQPESMLISRLPKPRLRCRMMNTVLGLVPPMKARDASHRCRALKTFYSGKFCGISFRALPNSQSTPQTRTNLTGPPTPRLVPIPRLVDSELCSNALRLSSWFGIPLSTDLGLLATSVMWWKATEIGALKHALSFWLVLSHPCAIVPLTMS